MAKSQVDTVVSPWGTSDQVVNIPGDTFIPEASTELPLMDGVASAGTSPSYARDDHVHPSDGSRVSQTQLAPVESGTTASQAYATGDLFVFGGVLCRATGPISAGATLTVGSNCETTTIGACLHRRFNLIDTAPQTLTLAPDTRAFLIVTSQSSLGMGLYGIGSSSEGVPVIVGFYAASIVTATVSGNTIVLASTSGCTCALYVYSGSISIST